MTLTITTIADGVDVLYARLTMVRKSDVTAAEREALEKRVNAGEWLRINDAAKALGISRSKVDLMMRKGEIGHRLEPGSRYRQCNPADIKKLLAAYRQEHRGESPATAES